MGPVELLLDPRAAVYHAAPARRLWPLLVAAFQEERGAEVLGRLGDIASLSPEVPSAINLPPGSVSVFSPFACAVWGDTFCSAFAGRAEGRGLPAARVPRPEAARGRGPATLKARG